MSTPSVPEEDRERETVALPAGSAREPETEPVREPEPAAAAAPPPPPPVTAPPAVAPAPPPRRRAWARRPGFTVGAIVIVVLVACLCGGTGLVIGWVAGHHSGGNHQPYDRRGPGMNNHRPGFDDRGPGGPGGPRFPNRPGPAQPTTPAPATPSPSAS